MEIRVLASNRWGRTRCKTDLIPESARRLSSRSYPTDGIGWMAFIRANCAALFQTALLLSADAEIAESGMLAAVASVDISRPPAPDELFVLQRVVAMQTLRQIRSNLEATSANARSLLQAGLWPVLHLEQRPRICFVLCLLLGYTNSSCAQILGIQEETVRELLRVATRQLHLLL
jgi:hypothetical protein